MNVTNSPYFLLQEIYKDDCWKIFVCCMLLNQTTRAQVDKIRNRFFEKWPTPLSASQANSADIADVISCLGFKNKRSVAIIKMSKDYLEHGHSNPKKLYGLGQYASDSYDIFVKCLDVKNPSDKVLGKYLLWKNAQLLTCK